MKMLINFLWPCLPAPFSLLTLSPHIPLRILHPLKNIRHIQDWEPGVLILPLLFGRQVEQHFYIASPFPPSLTLGGLRQDIYSTGQWCLEQAGTDRTGPEHCIYCRPNLACRWTGWCGEPNQTPFYLGDLGRTVNRQVWRQGRWAWGHYLPSFVIPLHCPPPAACPPLPSTHVSSLPSPAHSLPSLPHASPFATHCTHTHALPHPPTTTTYCHPTTFLPASSPAAWQQAGFAF